MLGIRHLVVLTICLTIAGGAAALVAPKDGKMPPGVLELRAKNPRAFNVKRAWSQKVKRIKQQREAYLAVNGPQALAALPMDYAVSGTMAIPVFLCEFANKPGAFDSLAVQTKLFGPGPGTVTDYYSEVSYGLLNMTGTVYDWVTLSNNDTYYEGALGCNGLCGTTMGQLMTEVLDAKDPQIDFGQYDNDGPDGIPNSGDDDGFVDFVAFVHSEYGGECGPASNNNIWSHQWVYSGIDASEQPYETDDPAAGGGFIQIDEYTMQPVLNCPPDNATLNEIGVFCHEFGHSFGLPDLYDINNTLTSISSGIGFWGIMGSGNWNQPDSPAHPCAWTRMQLGWVTPTDIGWQEEQVSIDGIGASGDVIRLGFTYGRFRRSGECTINGSYSLYCGLHQSEGVARGWGTDATDRGYGNTWNETIQREFTFDGNTPVDFSYQYRYDTEAPVPMPFDICYAIIEVDGVETVLDEFTGTGSGTAVHDISSNLSGLSPGSTYLIKFRATSDPAWADEDGNYNSDCGLFVVDDVSVSGGGESYTTDFETRCDGWYQPPSEYSQREYWLVENRQVYGYDAHLPGTGLLIMHIDETVIEAPFLGNSGGDTQGRVKGVVVEEADGLNQLRDGANRGDSGDVYPGTSNNHAFNANSTPSSHNNSGAETQVAVAVIGGSASTMTALMTAGDRGPTAVISLPQVIDNDVTALDVVVAGNDFVPGATFHYTYAGAAPSGPALAPADAVDIPGESVRWICHDRLEGTINVYSKTGGNWDLVVTNPDGQQFTLADAITINQIVAAQLQSAAIDVEGQAIRLEYVLYDREPREKIRLSRAPREESLWQVLASDLQPEQDAGDRYVYVDGDVVPGVKYFYKLEVVSQDGAARELHRGNATVPAEDLKLSQNFPNPFNPTTSIAFYLPERLRVQLEVFDVSGRLVSRLSDGVFEAGPHRVEWNGTDANGTRVSSGVYVYRLTAGHRSISKKMILLK
jgi:M6 family metalloprotease-like protein